MPRQKIFASKAEAERDWYRRHKNDPNYIKRKRKQGRDRYSKHAEEERSRARERGAKEKLRTLQFISGQEIPACVYCHCKDLRILESNRKSLGDNKLKRELKCTNLQLRRKILKGEIPKEDYEVTCKVCNIAHYVSKTFGVNYEIKLKE
jgi:hypothetical protein